MDQKELENWISVTASSKYKWVEGYIDVGDWRFASCLL